MALKLVKNKFFRFKHQGSHHQGKTGKTWNIVKAYVWD